MTISVWIDGTTKQERQVDVAIVGGGIAGATAAYWLSRRQKLKTIIVEQQTAGAGATGRSAGFIMRGIFAYYNQAVKTYGRETAKYIFQFNEETLAHIKDFASERGNHFDYDPCGSYLLACSIDELSDLTESAQLMQEDGFACEYLKEDPIDRDFYGAIHNAGDAAINPAKLVHALIDASSTTVIEREQVFEIQSNADGVTLRTPNYIVHAGKVLLCTNAYTPLIERWFTDKLKPVRGQIMVTKPVGKQVVDKLCYANYGYEYFRMLPDGRFLLGGCREPFKNEETGTYADMVTQPVQKALQNYLRDRFPDVAGTSIEFRWSGLMAFTFDGLPLLGELPPLPNVYFAAGCDGHGLGYSFSLSKLLVDLALDGAPAGIFSIDRLPAKTAAGVGAATGSFEKPTGSLEKPTGSAQKPFQ
jgi:glycine/D-amino acid oxidase-like deaminating enzyme